MMMRSLVGMLRWLRLKQYMHHDIGTPGTYTRKHTYYLILVANGSNSGFDCVREWK